MQNAESNASEPPRAGGLESGSENSAFCIQQSALSSLSLPVDIRLTTLPARQCSYLPDRQAQLRAFWAGGRLGGELYRELMDVGFRRSGRLVYQPVCGACRECVPLRVAVADFSPNKTQRRCWRRNSDLRVSQGEPAVSEEKWELYQRYVSQWHGRVGSGEADSEDAESFESFLYDSPVPSVEFEYRLCAAEGGALVAVGICDVSRTALSSVYFYFDPSHAARSLGTFGALWEIQWARERGLAHYYLGYWVAGCGAMRYKANFRPFELLTAEGQWRAGEAAASEK